MSLIMTTRFLSTGCPNHRCRHRCYQVARKPLFYSAPPQPRRPPVRLSDGRLRRAGSRRRNRRAGSRRGTGGRRRRGRTGGRHSCDQVGTARLAYGRHRLVVLAALRANFHRHFGRSETHGRSPFEQGFARALPARASGTRQAEPTLAHPAGRRTPRRTRLHGCDAQSP